MYVVSDFFDRPEYYYEQLDSGDVSSPYAIEFFRIIGEDPRPVLFMGITISYVDFWNFKTKEEAEKFILDCEVLLQLKGFSSWQSCFVDL